MSFCLIVGLGNITKCKTYFYTYHNAGHFLVNSVIQKKSCKKKVSSFTYATLNSTVWAYGNGFINESGWIIKQLCQYFTCPPEKLLIIYDDCEIMPGKCKLAFGTSAKGHNGLRHITQVLKTQAYWKLGLGIGRGNNVSTTLREHVLNRMSFDEQTTLQLQGEKIYQILTSSSGCNEDLKKTFRML